MTGISTRARTSWIQFDQTRLAKCVNLEFAELLELSGTRKEEK